MKILLTNDDGIKSPSLLALAQRLKKEHEVWTVAPDMERSGCSHAISIKKRLLVTPVGENSFSCSGTPADCVLVALLGLVKEKIDLVISGPNLGANLGTDIVYSGTVAAARQAVFMQVPAIAASLCLDQPIDFHAHNSPAHQELNGNLDYVVEFLAKNLSAFADLLEKDHFVNVNFPPRLTKREQAPNIRVTFPSVRIYNDKMLVTQSQNGDFICEITGDTPISHYAEGSDYEAVISGAISISPIVIHPVHSDDLSRYQQTNFWTRLDPGCES
jgi:5'-nucleotidase